MNRCSTIVVDTNRSDGEVTLKHILLGAAFVVAIFAFSRVPAAQAADTHRIVQAQVATPASGLLRTTYKVSFGPSALEKLNVIRVKRTTLQSLADPPVILVSPFGFPAAFWEISTTGYADSFVARIAKAGYDVWLLDSRVGTVAPGSCESGSVDCSVMASWGIESSISDAMFVQRLARLHHPFKRPVLGGLSGGSSTALATINRYPHHFAGLFLYEGTLYTADPAIRARNAAFCADDNDLLANDVYYDPAVQGFKMLFQLAEAAPNAQSPIPLFPPGTTNLQALLFAFTMPDATNPLNFTDDFVRFIGDPFAATLTYSDLARVMKFGGLIQNYAPVRFTRDSHCAMGGLDNTWTNNLNAFRGDVLVYAEGQGFGQMMVDTADLLTRADVTLDYHAELGESDRYFHHSWVNLAVTPLLNWLDDVRFGPF